MSNASVFAEQVKATKTELAEILTNAKEACMTVKFHKKIDPANVKTLLSSASANQLKDDKQRHKLAKELVTG